MNHGPDAAGDHTDEERRREPNRDDDDAPRPLTFDEIDGGQTEHFGV